MFKGIINFLKSNGNDLDLKAIEVKLDALEEAADKRIAAKEAYLAELTENVRQQQQEVRQLKEVNKRYKNSINRMNN
jgi:hypothetical protein